MNIRNSLPEICRRIATLLVSGSLHRDYFSIYYQPQFLMALYRTFATFMPIKLPEMFEDDLRYSEYMPTILLLMINLSTFVSRRPLSPGRLSLRLMMDFLSVSQ